MATGRVDVRAEPGWRRPRLTPSLAEVYRTVPVGQPVWWRKALAFAGPGYLVAVGYMDPGNWATDLAGGSAFGYGLLSIVLLSSMMTVLLQYLSAKLGIATGRDLAQRCRETFSPRVAVALWALCEFAIVACDLDELLGGLVPQAGIVSDPTMLYVAVGIIGATVMPHNLYLHSAIVQAKPFARTPAGQRDGIRFAGIDSTVALGFALLVNAAILILA